MLGGGGGVKGKVRYGVALRHAHSSNLGLQTALRSAGHHTVHRWLIGCLHR